MGRGPEGHVCGNHHWRWNRKCCNIWGGDHRRQGGSWELVEGSQSSTGGRKAQDRISEPMQQCHNGRNNGEKQPQLDDTPVFFGKPEIPEPEDHESEGIPQHGRRLTSAHIVTNYSDRAERCLAEREDSI